MPVLMAIVHRQVSSLPGYRASRWSSRAPVTKGPGTSPQRWMHTTHTAMESDRRRSGTLARISAFTGAWLAKRKSSATAMAGMKPV